METGRTRRQTKAAGGARGVSLPGNTAWQPGVLSTAPLAPLAPLLAQIGTKAPDLNLRWPKRRPEHPRPSDGPLRGVGTPGAARGSGLGFCPAGSRYDSEPHRSPDLGRSFVCLARRGARPSPQAHALITAPKTQKHGSSVRNSNRDKENILDIF